MSITSPKRISYKKCYHRTKWFLPFCMILLDGIPVGNPVSEAKAKIIVDFMNSMSMTEFDENDRLGWNRFD